MVAERTRTGLGVLAEVLLAIAGLLAVIAMGGGVGLISVLVLLAAGAAWIGGARLRTRRNAASAGRRAS